MLIMAGIVAIVQEVLMIFHKVNICGKIWSAGKGERNASPERPTEENIKLK
jgi:hypothetical protein